MCNSHFTRIDKTTSKANKKTGNTKSNEKRRNNEKRKEKSRDAARSRRSKETEIFTELGQLLPLPQNDVDQLDKASIMRLAIAFLKIRVVIELFQNMKIFDEKPDCKESDATNNELVKFVEDETSVLQALDGFLLILSVDGDITYVSENVSDYLGIQQIDIMGQPIWDFSHQCDHEELRDALNIRSGCPQNLRKSKIEEIEPYFHRDFLLRLKCTLTNRGRSVNIKSASYKVIHVSGHIVLNDDDKCELLAIGTPLPHPSNIEIPLGSSTFLTKHTLDMRFSYVDDKISLLGYQPNQLIGMSLYEYHHGADSESLMGTFKSVITKGQAETCRYRFLACIGGYCWIVTQATLVYDKQKPQSVVCVNYVIRTKYFHQQ